MVEKKKKDILAEMENGGGLTGIFGPSLSYKRYLEKKINSLNFDVGFYWFITFGVGINYNFTQNGNNLTGFKPFIGLSAYNFQLTYSYNFFSERNNKELQLGHNNISLKFIIPLFKF